jgi:hypothetical protein
MKIPDVLFVFAVAGVLVYSFAEPRKPTRSLPARQGQCYLCTSTNLHVTEYMGPLVEVDSRQHESGITVLCEECWRVRTVAQRLEVYNAAMKIWNWPTDQQALVQIAVVTSK